MNEATYADLAPLAVVDTDVVSFWQRGDSRGTPYLDALAGHTLVISFQTVAELLRWARQRQWSEERRNALISRFSSFIVHPYSFELAEAWADLMVIGQQLGRPIGSQDVWIAATALVLNAPLATHNRRHFRNVSGINLISFAPSAD